MVSKCEIRAIHSTNNHRIRDRWVSMTRRCVLVLPALFISISSSPAEDWPHWRGPNYDGHSRETSFKKSWKGELPILWSQPIGAGYSGIACVDGRIYTCGTADGHQTILCLNAKTGKMQWTQPIEKAYRDSMGSGPRATPTVEDGRVYIMGALGTAACLDAKNGETIWSQHYDHVPQWGYSGSILIQKNLAIFITGGKDGALRALDKKTGREVWKCGSDKHSGYSTPYPFLFDGTRYVCSLLGSSVVIVEQTTGRVVYTQPWKTDWKVNAATPIFHDGYLFLSSGYRTGCGLYKLAKVDGRIDAKEVWRTKVMKNKFQTPVLFEDRLYSFDQNSFKCVDYLTGEKKWETHGRHGTVILADGHLIALTQKGHLRIAKASPQGFEPTGEAQILEDRCWTVPTLSDGRLYARNMKRIVCVDLRS